MIKEITDMNIGEILDFTWERCQNQSTNAYPLRKTKIELEKSFMKSLKHPDDKVLAYYKEDVLIGVIELCIEVSQYYLRGTTYILKDVEDVMSHLILYLKENYPGFKAHFGYPKENVMTINYLKSNQYKCIEESNDMRLSMSDLTSPSNKESHIERLTKDCFHSYAMFHDSHGGEEMYWNSTRLYDAFDKWYIYLYKDRDEILGSILTCKCGDDAIEIFGLFVEDTPNSKDIVEDLLYHSILQIVDKELNIKKVIFFIDEKDRLQLEVAREIGFKEMGSYYCYEMML